MAEAYDFTPLFECYAEIIKSMPTRFASHEFLRMLAQRQQVLYIEALFAYRHISRSGKPAPFLVVHSRLAQELLTFTQLIRQVQPAVASVDLLGQLEHSIFVEKVVDRG
jgi:hypothetical protein